MTTLYKTNKNGSIQQWSVKVDGPTFICTFGQVDGKMQSKSTTCTGKNIGRANQTTPEQQAQLEAAALVTKKLKSGYSYDASAPVTVQLPMKVKSYQDQIHNVKFPCFSSPKLDGVNALYKRVDGKLIIFSRGGEVYPPIPHLETLVNKAMDLFGSNELNGELYVHGEFLQDIQSAVKKPNELSPRLSFCIFDISDSLEKFDIRESIMSQLARFCIERHPAAYSIPNVICNSHVDIEAHYELCISQGYEGTVVKNKSALYQHNVRSSDMFKYKKTLDAEYQIVDCESDKNGHPVFHCITPEGKLFKVKPKGTDAERKAIIVNFESQYLNQWYKIEYETLSKGKIPLKPVGIGLRDCDINGNPKE